MDKNAYILAQHQMQLPHEFAKQQKKHVYFLHLQGSLKGHKYTHAENEVQADDDDDDDDDDDADADADDNDAIARQGHSGLHTCMSFASRALHQNVRTGAHSYC